jgi:YVTN family beta-propeller protein
LIVKTLLFTAAVVFLAQPLSAANHPILLVLNRDANSLMFVNAKTHQIMEEVRVGQKPRELAVTPDGKTVFVSNAGDNRNFISVVDVDQMKEVRRIQQRTYWRPNGIAVSRDGSKLYVTFQGSRTAVEFDLSTDKILRTFPTRQKGTHTLAVTPDDKYLYTANSVSRNVSIFDLKTGRRIRHVKAAQACEGIGIKPDGSEVWVANRGENTITIINTSDNRFYKKIECGEHPKRIKFTPNGKSAVVTCPNSNVVRLIDTATYEIIENIKTGNAPAGLAMDPDGKRIYVSEVRDDMVSIFELETKQKTASIEVGEAPYAVEYVDAR